MKAADGIDYAKGYSVKEVSGKGMIGESETGDTSIVFGNLSWFEELGIDVPKDFCVSLIGTVSYIALNGELVGCLTFNDTVRSNASESINELKDLGVVKTVMLTGDRLSSAKSICDKVGIDTLHAELLPQDKLELLKELKTNGRVLAVGDGINDALALKESHVGVAMGAIGSDLAIQSADIALMNDNLTNIPMMLILARKTKQIIYQNIALSLGISFLMIVLSAMGFISALAGSLLHNVGAFVVILNSSRILKLNQLKLDI